MTAAQAIATAQPIFVNAKATTFSRKRLVIGRALTGLAGAFLLFDATMKLIKPAFVVQATTQVGYPESTIVGIGLSLLVSTLLYLIPRTSILGAVLLAAYLGGAVATNVRAELGFWYIVTPAIFACIAWAGLWLREPRLQQLLPLKRNA